AGVYPGAAPAGGRQGRRRPRGTKKKGPGGGSTQCRSRSDAAPAQAPPKTPASARRIRAAQRRQEFGSAPNRSLWKNGPISAWTRSYFEPQERRVVLPTTDGTGARVTRHGVAGHHGLDRTAQRGGDHPARVT